MLKVAFALSKDAGRPALNCLKMQAIKYKSKLQLTTTDGHRLARVIIPILSGDNEELNKGVLLCRTDLKTLRSSLVKKKDILQLSVTLQTSQFAVTLQKIQFSGDASLEFSIQEHRFPAVDNILQDVDTCAVVDREELIEVLKAGKLVCEKKFRTLELLFSDGQLEVRPSERENLHSKIILSDGWQSLRCGINPVFMIQALTKIKTKRVEISFTDSLAPIYIRPENVDGHLQLVMPLRLD